MRLSINAPVRFLWKLFGISLILFALPYVRLVMSNFNYKVAVPMLLLCCIFVISFVARAGSGRISISLSPDRTFARKVFFLTVFFIVWHLFGMLLAPDPFYAAWSMNKVSSALAIFFGMLLSFPREEPLLETCLTLALWVSSAVIIWLIYTYMFVFGVDYLGVSLDDPSAAGRNQLALFMAAMLPISFHYAFSRRSRTLLGFIPIGIFSLATLYLTSRGAWISIFIGIPAHLLMTAGKQMGQRITKVAKFGLLGATLFTGAWWFIATVSDTSMITSRFSQLVNPEELSPEASTRIRFSMAQLALEKGLDHPVQGNGLMFSATIMPTGTHNDYATLFCDLGGVGIISFLAIIWAILSKNRRVSLRRSAPGHWLLPATGSAVLTVTIFLCAANAYDNIFTWVIFAFGAIAADSVEAASLGAKAAPPDALSGRIPLEASRS